MSGTGGRGHSSENWRNTTEAGEADENKCDITDSTILSSPVSAVVQSLAKNDVLSIVLESQDPVRLKVKTKDGKTAGSITSKRMPDIVECIQKGFEYEAEVQSVDGGRVEVRVHRR